MKTLRKEINSHFQKHQPRLFETGFGYCIEMSKIPGKEESQVKKEVEALFPEAREIKFLNSEEKTRLLIVEVSWESMGLQELTEKRFPSQAPHFSGLLQALSRRPNSSYIAKRLASSLTECGLNLLKKNLQKEGEKFLVQAVVLDPEEFRAHLNLGKLYKRFLKEWSKAEYHYLRLLDKRPKNPLANLDLGEIYLRSSDYPRAIEYLKKFATLKPNSARAFRNLGKAYLKMESHEQARKHFLHALKIDREDKSLYLPLGECYYELENYEQARKFLKFYLDNIRKTARAYELLAYTYLERGEPKKAKKNLKRALKRAPDNMEAYRILGELYSELGDQKKSEKILGRYYKWKEIVDTYGGLRADPTPSQSPNSATS